jgi:hypothetical protein
MALDTRPDRRFVECQTVADYIPAWEYACILYSDRPRVDEGIGVAIINRFIVLVAYVRMGDVLDELPWKPSNASCASSELSVCLTDHEIHDIGSQRLNSKFCVSLEGRR